MRELKAEGKGNWSVGINEGLREGNLKGMEKWRLKGMGKLSFRRIEGNKRLKEWRKMLASLIHCSKTYIKHVKTSGRNWFDIWTISV